MATIRLTGYIDENGRIQIDQRVDLPPGAVQITVESISPEEQTAIDARRDELLSSPKSLALLEKLGAKALTELDAGRVNLCATG